MENMFLDKICMLKIVDFGVVCLEVFNFNDMIGEIGILGYMVFEVYYMQYFN